MERAPSSRPSCLPLAFAVAIAAGACSARRERGERPGVPSARAAAPLVRSDFADRPLLGATEGERARFDEGDGLFDATMREADGLGPLFVRASCAACHRDDGRGPGVVGKVAPEGATIRPYVVAATGARTPALAPEGPGRVTYRLPPAVFGRGYMEAVDDAEIERLAREAAARAGGVQGRIHRTRGGAIGRFGLKARIATLTEFTADALQGDMGLTSPLRPIEPTNPDGVLDDAKPGLDVDAAAVEAISDYVRLLELPARKDDDPGGRALFAGAGCAVCHVPALRTRADFPIAALAGIEAPLYTDFLLHDMGEALADGITEGEAGPRQWRTAPLVGLRFFPAYLHDGRARSVEEAIWAHEGPGSEGNDAVARFRALGAEGRAALVRFVSGL